ncbi:hypothetical protein E0H80_06465 [Acinetobacter sp. ANC 4779]|uniref:hypothetical protein n=1 Tax=Acinetobacter sp. ANC 4779 TaxID=2529848 RepID=UPI001038885C|nr:hypothetical protein [Acinetobacter sp. ANC 4779]TCB51005.1 hypothetical protein E0H80_06465 [Acinetobacter sp. ANC 4779]
MTNLEQAKDLIETLAARKIGDTGYKLSGEEVELVYEVLNEHVIRNEFQGINTKLPFEVVQGLKEVS